MLVLAASMLSFNAPAMGLPASSIRALSTQVVMQGGKGFGGGEATRDPSPTAIDPNDPKGKQQAIHKAESFAEYLAKRNAEAQPATHAAAAPPGAPSASKVWQFPNKKAVDLNHRKQHSAKFTPPASAAPVKFSHGLIEEIPQETISPWESWL